MLTKQETLLGRGTQVASRRVREPSAMWLSILGFIMMVMVSGLSLTNHSDSGSFMVAHTLLSQDGCWREGFWEVVGHVVSPFDVSWTILVGGGLLVLCSLPGPPVARQLMQVASVLSGQGRWFQLVFPLTMWFPPRNV